LRGGALSSSATRVWGNAALTSALVGTVLNANAYVAPFREHLQLRTWAIVRFYMIPFCVSSYSALANVFDFVALFPAQTPATGGTGLALAFGLALIMVLSHAASASPPPPPQQQLCDSPKTASGIAGEESSRRQESELVEPEVRLAVDTSAAASGGGGGSHKSTQVVPLDAAHSE
jgi:hypothetical protein